MGIIFQRHTEGNVQKARTQHWWEAICQKKKAIEKQGDPVKRSKRTEKKSMTKSAEARSTSPVEPNQDSSDSTELPGHALGVHMKD